MLNTSTSKWWSYADAARQYAREQILKGYTQLETNTLSRDRFEALKKGVADVRSACREEDSDLVSIGDTVANAFEESIKITSKFSLGNCGELAYQALNYFLIHPELKNIYAEVYYIKGGDHCFVVLRDPNSKASKPETWGKDALICDPWSNKVFPASEYLQQVKNYYHHNDSAGNWKNYTEDFNPSVHELSPLSSFYNTKDMRNKLNLPLLKTDFTNKMQVILATIDQYLQKIDDITHNKLNIHDERSWLLIEKVKPLYQLKTEIKQLLQALNKKEYKDYMNAKQSLMKIIQSYLNKTINLLQFTPEEYNILFKDDHKTKDDPKTIEKNKNNWFFFHKPNNFNLHKTLDEAINKANQQLNVLYRQPNKCPLRGIDDTLPPQRSINKYKA